MCQVEAVLCARLRLCHVLGGLVHIAERDLCRPSLVRNAGRLQEEKQPGNFHNFRLLAEVMAVTALLQAIMVKWA